MRSVSIPVGALRIERGVLTEATRTTLIEHGLIAEAGAFSERSAIVNFAVPRGISSKFPGRGSEDPTPPHVTLLVVGDVTGPQWKTVQRIAAEVASEIQPFTVRMSEYAEFNYKGSGGVNVNVPHMRVESSYLWWLHKTLWTRLKEAGVPVAHRYGAHSPGSPSQAHFEAHATLGIHPGKEPDSYDGPRPTGSWTVSEFGIGIGSKKPIKVKLGQPVAVTEAVSDVTSAAEALAFAKGNSLMRMRRSQLPPKLKKIQAIANSYLWADDEPTGMPPHEAVRLAILKVFPEAGARSADPRACAKCMGRGTIRSFSHVLGGKCFDCGGSGKIAEAALTEAAKKLSALPDKFGIAIASGEARFDLRTEHNIDGNHIVTFWNMETNKQADRYEDGLFGAISMFEPESAGHGECGGAYIVGSSGVRGQDGDGFGPLLYDAAVEFATDHGGSGLTSDRTSVSDEAHRVWDYYLHNRNDVQRHELDTDDSYEDQHTPDDYTDDCTQTSANRRDGWPDAAEAHYYSKKASGGVLATLAKQKRLVLLGSAKWSGGVKSSAQKETLRQRKEAQRLAFEKHGGTVSMVKALLSDVPYESPLPLTGDEIGKVIRKYGSATVKLGWEAIHTAFRSREIGPAQFTELMDDMLDASEKEMVSRLAELTPDIRRTIFSMWDSLSTEYLFFVRREFVNPTVDALLDPSNAKDWGLYIHEEAFEGTFDKTIRGVINKWYRDWERTASKKRGVPLHPYEKKRIKKDAKSKRLTDKILKLLEPRPFGSRGTGSSPTFKVGSRVAHNSRGNMRGTVVKTYREASRPPNYRARADVRWDDGRTSRNLGVDMLLPAVAESKRVIAPEHDTTDMPVRGGVKMRRPKWLEETELNERSTYFGSEKPVSTPRWDVERIEALVYHGIVGRQAERASSNKLLRRIATARKQIASLLGDQIKTHERESLLTTLADAERDIKAGRSPRTGSEPEPVKQKEGGLWSWLFGESFANEDPRNDEADVYAVLSHAAKEGVWDGLPRDELADRCKLPDDRMARALGHLDKTGKLRAEKGPDGVMRYRLRPGATFKGGCGSDSTLSDSAPRVVNMPRSALS